MRVGEFELKKGRKTAFDSRKVDWRGEGHKEGKLKVVAREIVDVKEGCVRTEL